MSSTHHYYAGALVEDLRKIGEHEAAAALHLSADKCRGTVDAARAEFQRDLDAALAKHTPRLLQVMRKCFRTRYYEGNLRVDRGWMG